MDTKIIWKDTLDLIKISISQANFQAWFPQTFITSAEDLGERYAIEIGCPTAFSKNTIEGRYFGLVQDSLTKITGKPCDLIFIVKQDPEKMTIGQENTPLFSSKNQENNNNLEVLQRAKIRPIFTFEDFAVSGSNQMAYAAAEAVADSPGVAYNPLFIWGGVGVGKTHLMHAVGNSIVRKNRDTKILACTAEDFTNDIVEGIRSKTTPEVRKKYRKLGLLLIDDIQFIAGKDTAQEEFFHTFNAVTSAGGQVILTSDRPPAEIAKLEERLRSRFEAGLIVDISSPDFELRCAITQIKSEQKNLNLEMDQIQMIAANAESARKIEGILTKIMTEIHIKKSPITSELVESILGKGVEANSGAKPKVTAQEAIDVVSKYYSIGKRSLLGESRERSVARPRQMLMYLLRTYLRTSLEEVGRLVGDRDHTTVMHAVNKITQLAASDVNIREDIVRIKQSL